VKFIYNKVYQEDTILERLGLLCWMILLLPIIIVSYIVWKILTIRDRVHEWLVIKNLI
jgi:hypothetical protein